MTGLEALREFKGNNNTILVGRIMGKQHYLDCLKVMEKSLKAVEILKPLCEVVETPVKKYRYLKVNGVVVYTFKNEEEFELLKEVLE